MNLLKRIIKKTRPEVYDSIKKEVLLFRDKYVGSQEQILQDDIFRIAEDINGLDLLLFPVEDDELCGFICDYKGQLFIYVNTHLPYEKQIFTLAHELYHYLKNGDKELLNSRSIDETEELDMEDRKANLFAALLLVPEKALQNQLELMKIRGSSDIDELKLIKLMNVFAVPYKTIVLRLLETGILKDKEAKSWLEIPDRDLNKGILYLINKHKVGERWQNRTDEVKFSNLKALIYDSDELELLPENRIKKDLSLLEQDDVSE